MSEVLPNEVARFVSGNRRIEQETQATESVPSF